jgi:Cu-Zn family superoxide dismutase
MIDRNYDNYEIFRYLSRYNPFALAQIKGGTEFQNIKGIVEFYKMPQGIIVVANIENLPKTDKNIFAFHIHNGTSCDDNFMNTGEHYNPTNSPHPLHAGDMPPLFSNNGFAWSAFYTTRFNENEIIGKTVLIHDNVDDFTSQPSGNSGEKIACGVIVKA